MSHDLAPYPDLQALFCQAELAAKAGGAETVIYGHSVEGRPLRAFRFPSESATPMPVLLGANLHGVEIIGAYVALRFMQAWVRDPCPLQIELQKRAELWVIPSYNPDGYQKTFEQKGLGPLRKLRTNARGVDLNRNFPRPSVRPPRTFGFAGSTRPGAGTYRGPCALSEPESQHLFEWLSETSLHTALNLHSFSGAMIPGRVRGAHDFKHYRRLHRAYLEPQTGPRFFRLHSRFVDAWTGELEDAQHHLFGTWAACVELVTIREILAQRSMADRVFWRFNPTRPELHAKREITRISSALLASCDFPTPQERLERSLSWDLQPRTDT